jgi:hypothetical protein
LKKIAIYLSLGQAALNREHPALQKKKFINCFLFFWVTYALLCSSPCLDLLFLVRLPDTYTRELGTENTEITPALFLTNRQ